MRVDIFSLLEGAQSVTGVAVIIDVFRAFTTAAIAFHNGASKILLVAEVEEALRIRNERLADFCMGEVDGIKPDGFDFGNSPFELSHFDLSGKVLVQSTRAGTVGVVAAGRASLVYLGSLVNAQATVTAILGSPRDSVGLVAMGSYGRIRSDEDEQCALYMRNLLLGRRPNPDSVRELIQVGEESQKYWDPARPQFDPNDLDLALQINRFKFAMPVHHEDGLLVATSEAVL